MRAEAPASRAAACAVIVVGIPTNPRDTSIEEYVAAGGQTKTVGANIGVGLVAASHRGQLTFHDTHHDKRYHHADTDGYKQRTLPIQGIAAIIIVVGILHEGDPRIVLISDRKSTRLNSSHVT